MDFRNAALTAPSTIACDVCKAPLTDTYYVARAATVCRSCGTVLGAGTPPDGRMGRVFGALALGSLFGLGGTILYSAIIAFANYELALLTILIGWLVGLGVQKGSRYVGGLGYQVMAAILTYVLCMFAYVPTLVSSAMEGPDPLPMSIATIVAIPFSLFMPFTGEMGIIGIAILAFGMWQGFKMPVEVPINLEGPFAIAKPAPIADADADADAFPDESAPAPEADVREPEANDEEADERAAVPTAT